MSNYVQVVIEEIQHNIVSSYEQYISSGNAGEKTFKGFIAYASEGTSIKPDSGISDSTKSETSENESGVNKGAPKKFFLPWAKQYQDSLKEKEPTIKGFLAFCSREFFLSREFQEGEVTNGHIGAYNEAIATSAQNGTAISPSFSGFLKFLCSGGVVSKDKFLTFADVAASHKAQLKSPLLRRGDQPYDGTRDSMTKALGEGIINPNNFLLKVRDTSESLALNQALIEAFNSACRQSGLLNCKLPENAEIRHDHIKLPAKSKGGDVDAMLLELDDGLTDAWRYAAIMVLEVLDDNEVLKPLKGTELGQLIVQEVQARCITGFLTVDLLTRPIGQQARDALRQETNAAKSFLDSLDGRSYTEKFLAGELVRKQRALGRD